MTMRDYKNINPIWELVIGVIAVMIVAIGMLGIAIMLLKGVMIGQ